MNCARLVRFMASAYDTRYARDHGLSVECLNGHLQDGLASPETLDGLLVLRRLRPLDSALRAMEKGGAVTAPLFDPQGALLGQRGVADLGAHWRRLGHERLKPLARVAEAELTALRTRASSVEPIPPPR